jgi:methylenetetrahydrofolate dehydrogenase (NADP+)/methenyltetrahydrofolate cyclohydrolase
MIEFDGKKTRDRIMEELKIKVARLPRKPVLAVVWAGDNLVSARYVEAKKKAAEKIGVGIRVFKFVKNAESIDIINKIKELNEDKKIDGILVQLPLPENFRLSDVIDAISPEKDVDALRFCGQRSCTFRPPVSMAILEAVKESGVSIFDSVIALIGRGFLVNDPLYRILVEYDCDVRVVDEQVPNIGTVTQDADIVISATGKPDLIKPPMIKNGVVLIDAGTTEVKGSLRGDVDPLSYLKSKFYTPVPGGIGPVTVAMLFKNLIEGTK